MNYINFVGGPGTVGIEINNWLKSNSVVIVSQSHNTGISSDGSSVLLVGIFYTIK